MYRLYDRNQAGEDWRDLRDEVLAKYGDKIKLTHIDI